MARQHSTESLRPIAVQTAYLDTHPASVLYCSGRTKVLCVASLESGVPPFLIAEEQGWATAEYDILPGATLPRRARERSGKVSGRTQEIQRLIGRSLRGVIDLTKLTGWTLRLDCDVIQADGGTRTAAISGGYVAAAVALRHALRDGRIAKNPLRRGLAAVSVGLVDGATLLDLDYEEDSTADVDLNVVKTSSGEYLEIQGTAERRPFSHEDLQRLLSLADHGIQQILRVQQEALKQSAI